LLRMTDGMTSLKLTFPLGKPFKTSNVMVTKNGLLRK
jgi:hypothetical protein